MGSGFLFETAAKLVRRKDAVGDVLATNLRRCLSTLDVAFFGIGNMLGSGSAYSYTYFALGEIIAFFVGWNLIMENVLSLAVVARTCSSYANSLSGGVIRNFTINIFGWITHEQGSYLSRYPDVLSALLLVSFLLFMLLGAKNKPLYLQETSWLNNTLVIVNITIMAVIFGIGAYHADFTNWEYDPKRDAGRKPTGFINGFLPYGWSGVFSACAKCFFAYVGFDGIAAAGEEAKNPRKSIPIATLLTMSVVSTVYISVSGVLTLMLPYYEISPDAGIPNALKHYNAYWAVYIVSGGAIASMVTVIMGTIFAVSRIMYAMAEDGLLPSFFHCIFRKVPFMSMITCTVAASVLAIFFDTEAIIEMLSIGTLFAYLIVAFGIIVVRHSPTPTEQHAQCEEPPRVMLRLWAMSSLQCLYPSRTAHKSLVVATLLVAVFFAFGFGFSVNIKDLESDLRIALIFACGVPLLLTSLYITPLKELLEDNNYKMPLMPFLPMLSMSLNAFLMTTMDPVTWYRFLVWLVLGLTVYFADGFRHSKLNQPQLAEEFDHS
ncbi:cationic amino acid transporter 3-like [Tropilaelaps mercedesae]|uniref:Cationic amino acid transporter 3-like n=1 Tax=Tropilaelaps mercedesae TaxID=418985 RepID=A0A1V9Y3F2_9ACAR|nr:cationic amino acid transporter 3-like [Tropilaelaps mercedesae]